MKMKVIIVDGRITEACERSLLKEGYTLIKLPKDIYLGDAVASHPDTVMFYSLGEIITTADYCDCAPYIFSDIREYCPNIKINFSADVRGKKYPNDCIMNALVVNRLIFCKTDTVSKHILDFAQRYGYEVCHTNQGYPSCSVLSFGNNAITADEGMAAIMREKGVEVTLISRGGISLPPHEYGFIGGASGVVGNKIYFFGDVMTHPDGDIICKTIKSAGYTPISLSCEPLCDFGGIIAL